MRKLIKSTGFQMFLFVAFASALLYWAIGLSSEHEGVSAARDAASTAQTQAETTVTVTPLPSAYPDGPTTSFSIKTCEVELKVVEGGYGRPRQLALYQQDLPVANMDMPQDVTDFRVMSYEIGATHAAYINVELGGRFVEVVSNDMYWLSGARGSEDDWRIKASMQYVDDIYAVTTTVKRPTDNLSCHLNTQWKLIDGMLYADDKVVLYRVLSPAYFPLVQTGAGWSMMRYDKDEGWIAIPFKVYESGQQELLKLIESISEVAPNEAQHGTENRLERFGFTSDDVDTARHTYKVS